ncbi:MAG: hypothetical protein QM662_00240 [Gordonia sp. (in: high G+C Gram-positive bacteria)]
MSLPARNCPDEALLADLIHRQCGVLAAWQVLGCGYSPADIRRTVRRREWATVVPGIYVTHTGPLTWDQRAWSAVLDAHPAALSHTSALPRGGRSTLEAIHIVVDSRRRVTRRRGVVVHYSSRFADIVVADACPPRVRTDEAVLDLAGDAVTEIAAIAVLADAVQARTTTAARLLAASARRRRLRRRALIEGVLADIQGGTCSVLEHGYLTKVERAHGLPRPRRQAPTTVGRRGLRDLDYPEWGVVIELDGRTHHDNARARDLDMERDLDAAVHADRVTLRLGWGQVFRRPCSTAEKIGRMLGKRGWQGEITSCPLCGSPRMG